MGTYVLFGSKKMHSDKLDLSRPPTMEEFRAALKKLFMVERLDAEITQQKQFHMFGKYWQDYMGTVFTAQEIDDFMECPLYQQQTTGIKTNRGGKGPTQTTDP